MSVSTDGKTLYYRKRLDGASDSSSSLFAFIERDLASGLEKELVRGNLGYPALSPDGRYLATRTDDVSTQRKSIMLVPVAGGEPRILIRAFTNRPDVGVLWAPDSRSVVIDDGAAEFEVWASIDGRVPPKPVVIRAGVRVSPDGRRFAMVEGKPNPTQQEVWVYENVLAKAGPKR